MNSVKSLETHRKVSESLLQGKSASAALRDAGYSANTVKAGPRAISKTTLRMLGKAGQRLVALSQHSSPEALQHLAVGRLMENCVKGRDAGVMSAKTLGSHRDLNLWTPESQAGTIVFNMPTVVVNNAAKVLAEPEPITIDAVEASDKTR